MVIQLVVYSLGRYWASSIKIQRDRQLKNGSTALTRVPTATRENARPVQKFS